jgi:hypothetical protein
LHVRKLVSALALATFALIFAVLGPAQAQEWPQRQVTIVVPFSAGGTTDMFARILAQGLSQKYLQQKYGTPAPEPAAMSAQQRSRERRRTATRCSSAR